MEAGKQAFCCPGDPAPGDILKRFIGVFAGRGWLGKDLRIRRDGRRYRIFCSREKFLAYRINDNSSIPPGIPGWPVCVVTIDRIMEDAHLSGFASMEPSAYEWLMHIEQDTVEII